MSPALLAEALLVLPVARIVSRTVRFATVAQRMGWVPEEELVGQGRSDLALARNAGAAVITASRFYRMKDACLAESIAAKWMLGRRGVAATLAFGWRIRGSAALAPAFVPETHAAFHAWVEAEGETVTGELTSPHEIVGRYC